MRSGELARLIHEDGLKGMTSNPTIFEKAVATSTLYDSDIQQLADQGRSPAEIFEALAVADVQAACDVFRRVYDQDPNGDGAVPWKCRRRSPMMRKAPSARPSACGPRSTGPTS